jgi:hypothetical protein
LLTSDPNANVGLLLQEYQQASPLAEGLFDANFCEQTRRNLWPGQSPDGRKWDDWSPDSEPVLPYNGASDCRPFTTDGVINDAVALGMAAFRRGELRADTVNPDTTDLVGPLSAYAHWLVRKRYKKALEAEAELSLQYVNEYGYCVAFVGWERELCKEKRRVTLEELAMIGQQVPEYQGIAQMILDGNLDDYCAQALRSLYKLYVMQEMAGKGFFEDELENEALLDLHLSTARRYVRELRENGKTDVPMPYVSKNRPLVYVARPYHEFLCSRGTTDLQSARVLFLRRTFTEAELDAKVAEGWDETWIEKAKKTKGALSMWGNPGGQATISTSAPSKVVGGERWYKLMQNQYDRIEVVYAFRRNTDENGVAEIYQTIFSPHFEKTDDSRDDSFALHELVDYAHGQYPFVSYKREQLGRGLTESRSVGEIESTSERMEKEQLDMLFNRAQLETMPPIGVPKLGGVDYRIGPGAQVPVKRGDEFKRILDLGPAPMLAIELVKLLRVRRDGYFGRFNAEVPTPIVATKQEKAASDFFTFWGDVFKHMMALTVQYNPQEAVRVSGVAQLAALTPRQIVEEVDVSFEFDAMELDREYLVKKLEVINAMIVPGDVTGAIDRSALTNLMTRMVDSRFAGKILQDKGQASQKLFDEVMNQTVRMAQGNAPTPVENDPAAGMKLQYFNDIVTNNKKYQELLASDKDFAALMENYYKTLNMSVMQQQNKQVGRIGVKPMGAQA